MPVLFYGVFMKINIHEFDKDNRLFTALGLNAKFFPQLERSFSETEEFLNSLSFWGIVPRAIRYKSILNYDCIVLVGRIANDSGKLFVLDKCANPYVEIAKHLNLNQDSKVLVYLAEPIFTSISYEGRATKQIIKFLKNYK